jgi:hypothetical protein
VIEPFRPSVDVVLSQAAKAAMQTKGYMAFIFVPPCARNARGLRRLPIRRVQAVAFVSDRRGFSRVQTSATPALNVPMGTVQPWQAPTVLLRGNVWEGCP